MPPYRRCSYSGGFTTSSLHFFYRYRGAVWPGGKCIVQAAAAGKFFRPHPTACIADLAEEFNPEAHC